ncbi:MAG: hypothetical protein L0G82_04245 [Pseudomonas sp.]|nr:hypothetical protein [Pseudomonas sp.]
MKKSEFRAELMKIMPGYSWTIHNTRNPAHTLIATGTQSSGSNRLSTLQVERRDNYAASGHPLYEVKSAGYGKRAPWLHVETGRSLAKALRNLQDHYEVMARKYAVHLGDMQRGRRAPGDYL